MTAWTDDQYLVKIAGLLRKAETTTNATEAEAYMQKAQRLATTREISLEVARQHVADKEKRESPIQKQIRIGERGRKGLKYYVQLFLVVAQTNGITCDIALNSTSVFAFGMPSDIEMAELLYSSLVYQMIESSERFLRSGEYKKDTTWTWSDRHDAMIEKPVDGRVARGNFQQAFISVIQTRLYAARAEAIAEADANAPSTDTAKTGTEIILRNKSLEVADFHKTHSTARGSWGGFKGPSAHSERAYGAGSKAGQSARLGANRAIGGSRGQISGS